MLQTFGATDADGELSCAGATGVADEPGLVDGEDAVLDAGPVDADLGGVGGAGDPDLEWGTLDVGTTVFNG